MKQKTEETKLNIVLQKYVLSKMMSEKELLGYNDGEGRAFEVVTLPCGLVAGDTVLGRAPETLENAVSPVSRNEPSFAFLRLLQRLVGSVPLVHADDVCDALVFCMDQPSLAGRFLCSAAYPTIHDIVEHFAAKYPHLDVLKEYADLSFSDQEQMIQERLYSTSDSSFGGVLFFWR
jgi:nucleoside-diphosphate-sugar epimerase